jgi:hypothetical protein
VVSGGVQAAPSLIGVSTQMPFPLQVLATHVDGTPQPPPAGVALAMAHVPRLQNPLKHPSKQAESGGFG